MPSHVHTDLGCEYPQSSQNAPQHQVTLVRTQLPISPIRDRIGGIMAVCGMKRDRSNETFFPEPAPNTALDELMGEMKSLIDHRKSMARRANKRDVIALVVLGVLDTAASVYQGQSFT